MRALLILSLTLIAGSARAWDFAATPLCTLADRTDRQATVLQFDPGADQPWSITMTLQDGTWPAAPGLTMAFLGGQELVIGTDRHILSDGARSVTVRDRGFDNVIAGLAQNQVAIATMGDRVMEIPLAGIAGPLQQFLDCLAQPIS
jgi:hypothetical protein